MATMHDLDELALAMPLAEKQVDDEGRASYSVHGKVFCFERPPRKDAVDAQTGKRLTDVLMFRTESLEQKEMLLVDPRGAYFTTPHFDGYAAVLVRIAYLARLTRDDIDDLVVEAWLTRAQKRVAKAWLAEQEG